MICPRMLNGERSHATVLKRGFRLPMLIWTILVGLHITAICNAQERYKSRACSAAEDSLRSGGEALDRGDLAEAERLLLPLQSSHPACGEALSGLARVRALQKDSNAAEQLFFRSIELSPDDAHPYFYFAEFSFARGDFRRADDLTNKALALDTEYPDALVLTAQILAMKGESTAAQEMMEKVCRIAPKNAEAHFQLGILFDNKKLHREAVEQFERAVALRPTDPRAYDYLALSREALGEAEKAATIYKRGLAVNNGPFFDYFLDYNYGRMLMKQHKLRESKVHLDRAVSLAPETRAVYYERGKLNMTLGEYQQARRDAEQALSLADPSGFVLDLQLYYLLATVYSRLGENELAHKYAELSRTATVPIQDRARN
jgi:tetratricopeptide (TPR) repeat protein